MVLQLGYCTEIFKAFHNGIGIIFIFDNTWVCDIGRYYRLNVTNTNSGYVRTQQEMHPTNTKKEVSRLGPYEKIIEVGDGQNMEFQESGDVPLYITPQEHTVTKLSHCDEHQLKDKTKYGLLGNLKSAGMDISAVKGTRVG